MRKNAQIVTFSIVAAASIIFGMVLAGGAKWTPSSLAESEAAPAAGRAVAAMPRSTSRSLPSPTSPSG